MGFKYLLPISLLILPLGSLTDSVAINDYISVYISVFSHQSALLVKAVCPAHVTVAVEHLLSIYLYCYLCSSPEKWGIAADPVL